MVSWGMAFLLCSFGVMGVERLALSGVLLTFFTISWSVRVNTWARWCSEVQSNNEWQIRLFPRVLKVHMNFSG